VSSGYNHVIYPGYVTCSTSPSSGSCWESPMQGMKFLRENNARTRYCRWRSASDDCEL